MTKYKTYTTANRNHISVSCDIVMHLPNVYFIIDSTWVHYIFHGLSQHFKKILEIQIFYPGIKAIATL